MEMSDRNPEYVPVEQPLLEEIAAYYADLEPLHFFNLDKPA